MSTASMENKKAKRAPCKRVRENEKLDSIESTSGLVQQHAPPTTMEGKNA